MAQQLYLEMRNYSSLLVAVPELMREIRYPSIIGGAGVTSNAVGQYAPETDVVTD